MSFFKKLFGKKEQQIQINRNRYAEFWQWFEQHQQDFHRIVDELNKIPFRRISLINYRLNWPKFMVEFFPYWDA
jgi:hypothetical protein